MQQAAENAFDLRKEMPLLSRHEGVWEGMYRYYDAQGDKVDEHHSKLICRFTNAMPNPYLQTNIYTWSDGRTETREFSGAYDGERLQFDNDLIRGWAADVGPDENKRTSMLYWKRKDDPDTYLYEMIQLSDCGQFRSRVWHWIKDGQITHRTLIDEHKVSDSWADS